MVKKTIKQIIYLKHRKMKKEQSKELYNIAEMTIGYKTKVKASERIVIRSSKESANVFKYFIAGEMEYREVFYVLCLNRANHVLCCNRLSSGGIAGTYVDIKHIFQVALNCNASSIIVAHNHPSGNAKPSQDDIVLTKKIKEVGKAMEMHLFDHIIVTEESYFSFADESVL